MWGESDLVLMARGPDYQKREAKRSLWDMDGEHVPKKYRNKGKGRGKDKQLIKEQLDPNEEDYEILQMLNKEADEAMYCYHYGPCEKCLNNLEE